MTRPGSTLDEEPLIIDSPLQDKDREAPGSDTSDESDDGASSVKKKFEVIMHDLKKNKRDLRDIADLNKFEADFGSCLGMTTGDGDNNNTLLHLLGDYAKDKYIENYQPLIKLLIDRYPKLLEGKDNSDRNPLHIAIYKKRDKLVRFMCNTYPKIDTILGKPGYQSQNCLHIAIHRNVTPELAVFLIEHAGEATLCAKDSEGNTPLHLAVDYDRCTEAQLEVVKALILRCDKAVDERTDPPNAFSPYRYHEHTRAKAKEKEKEGKKDESSTAGGNAPGGKESMGVKFKGAIQAKDAKSSKPVIGSSFGTELGKIEALGLGSTNSEALLEKSSSPGKSYGGSGGAGSGKYKTAGLASGSGLGEPPDILRRIPTGLGTLESSNGKESILKTPVAPKKEKRKQKANVTDDSADMIKDFLKLHCMRTRSHDDTAEFLYGRNQEKEIFFDIYEYPSLTISEEPIEDGLAHMKFEDVLQYVALPSIRVERKSMSSKYVKSLVKPPEGKGRSDMVFLFNFLRRNGVKRVIRIIVDDTLDPAHSDEAIEKALGGLKVEVWDWRKYDLCTQTIVTAAPDAREVCLFWSGNNAVLRGWSEPGGLKLLGKLKKVQLHVKQGLETAKRMQQNIDDFRESLKLLRPDIIVEVIKEDQPQKYNTVVGPIDTPREQVEHRHKWLTCMDDFADFIYPIEPPRPLDEPVTIALIDDGVDINEQSLHTKIMGGRSFCLRDRFQNLNKPYYVSGGGHGTVMASLICRVCPNAQVYVLKLEEYMSEHSTRQITAQSAAKAVRAAIDKRVHIISMSWTIERTLHNASDIQKLESAVEDAAKAGILMFCAANDQGIANDASFPAACGGTKHLFKIGAAEASGAVWKWVGDPGAVDFIFPGHNVVKERPSNAPLEKCRTLTGSSVATAIAAGLAALVLYCVQLGALHTQVLNQQLGPKTNAVTMEDFKAIKRHERMKEAFLAIGTSQASGNKYVEVWDVFGPAAKKAEGMEKEQRIKIVTGVAERLKMRKTFE